MLLCWTPVVKFDFALLDSGCKVDVAPLDSGCTVDITPLDFCTIDVAP